jgi:hypothetical protein
VFSYRHSTRYKRPHCSHSSGRKSRITIERPVGTGTGLCSALPYRPQGGAVSKLRQACHNSNTRPGGKQESFSFIMFCFVVSYIVFYVMFIPFPSLTLLFSPYYFLFPYIARTVLSVYVSALWHWLSFIELYANHDTGSHFFVSTRFLCEIFLESVLWLFLWIVFLFYFIFISFYFILVCFLPEKSVFFWWVMDTCCVLIYCC